LISAMGFPVPLQGLLLPDPCRECAAWREIGFIGQLD